MDMNRGILFMILFLAPYLLPAQDAAEDYIRSKEGRRMFNKKEMVFSCLRSLNKDRSDPVAVQICECQINAIDGYFSQAQYRKYTKNNLIDLPAMLKDDNTLNDRMQACYTASGKTILLGAERSSENSIADCMESVKNGSNKTLDTTRLKNFCACQVELIKVKQLSDADMKTISDPNSLLFFELIHNCGYPFSGKESPGHEWTSSSARDVRGPEADTISTLDVGGMSFVKLKIGSQVLVWLLDTGASELLITKEMEEALKNEKILSQDNYLGTEEFEMANGLVDPCRRYRVNNVRIGKFYLDNIIVSVSETAKRLLVGRSLLNKFSNWTLDNRSKTLVLSK
jgi:predicted aspartyl protease